MRPLKLTMTAFGPYRDAETIDFAELKEHRLFVISGNTGAGKTTIFDAICFALYGEASGEDRSDRNMLRSQFAPDDVHTSVDFVFALRGRVYRVFRQLAHVKTGNRSATGDRQEIYECADGQEIPLVERFTARQVDAKIRELIGLDKDQFSQIVMLPQGEFRKLLTSDTENKEEILRRIFKTGLYKLLAEQLNEKRREAQSLCDGMAGIRDRHVQRAKDLFAGRDGSALAEVFQQEHVNVHQVLEALDKDLETLEESVRRQTEHLKELAQLYRQWSAAHAEAVQIEERFRRLEQLEQELERLEAERPLMEEKRRRLQLAERAVHLKVYERQAAEAEQDHANKRKERERASRLLAEAEERLRKGRELLEAEEARAPLREEAARQLDRLNQLVPKVRELEQRRQAAAAWAAERDRLEAGKLSAAARLDEARRNRQAALQELQRLELETEGLAELAERLSESRQLAALLEETVDWQRRWEQASRQQSELWLALEEAEKACAAMERAWMEGQAGLLASRLREGEPCPVCGSTEHPHKAETAVRIRSGEQLEEMRRNLRERERLYHDARAAESAALEQLERKRRQLADCGFEADGWSAADLETRWKDVSASARKLEQRARHLKELQADAHNLKQAAAKWEQTEQEWLSRKEELDRQLSDVNARCAAEQALYEEILRSLPEGARDEQALEAAISAGNDRLRELEQAWKYAQELHLRASEEASRASVRLEHAAAAEEEAAVRLERARAEWREALSKAGFADEAAYRQAKMSEADMEDLRRRLERHAAAIVSAQEQVRELRQDLTGRERVDPESLKRQLEQLEQQTDRERALFHQLELALNSGRDIRTDIVEADRLWQQAERRFQLARRLYDVVRGENSRKLSFERYLQIEFLDRIIDNANRRLQDISNGQFFLAHSDRMEKRGRQSGLGLDVYDAYTGQFRDVKTLSGGEKFNASLCLALGMADVIQSFEGGVSLETMLIDEGFGNLDEESLQKAIDTLIELQQSGRMIGVISHVPELKRAIPAVLEVYKTREGHSRTKFAVASV